MKRVVLVTKVDPFGRRKSGYISALIPLIDFLASKSELTVYITDPEPHVVATHGFGVVCAKREGMFRNLMRTIFRWIDKGLLRFVRMRYRILFESFLANINRIRNRSTYSKRTYDGFKEFIQNNEFDIVIIERLPLHYLVDAFDELRRPVLKVIDTHDLLSLRTESFKRSGYEPRYSYTFSEEIALLKKFDLVLLIQSREYEILRKAIGTHAVLVTRPQQVNAVTRTANQTGKLRVLFFASDAIPNLDAYYWLVQTIWNVDIEQHASLGIAGTICRIIPRSPNSQGITILGEIEDPDALYAKYDVFVNPTRIGSGLKIKNLEALAHGLPVLTTSIGLEGLESGLGNGIYLCETAGDFAKCTQMLNDDRVQLNNSSNRAIDFIRTNFSINNCFNELEHKLGLNIK